MGINVTIIRSLVLVVFVLSGCDREKTAGSLPAQPTPQPQLSTDALVEDVEHRTFQFFWDVTNPKNGLVPDRYPTPSFASIAAVGFGLTAYVVGADRGYITREQAHDRVLQTLRFFDTAKMGPEPADVTGYQGFYYHFLDMDTGRRYETVELSTVDTSLLLAGMLLCESYFDRPGEEEIRALVERIYRRVDWRWAQTHAPLISHGWKPESGFIKNDWEGYNEAMLVYILALGSPTHAVDPDAWKAWASTYSLSWGKWYGQEHLGFGPLFGHQYSHTWIDFRGIRDDYMRTRNLDYFENSQRAVYAQQAYARANPMGWKGYAIDLWGFTACDGPIDAVLNYNGEQRKFWTYAARGAPSLPMYDDGTLSPTAAASSMAFAPEIALQAMRAMYDRYGKEIYGDYGFVDAFNPSFQYDIAVRHGHRVGELGWVDNDYLGIDQGPIVAMIENYRTQLIWKTMRKNPHVRRGLERAGFTGGWLAEQPTSAATH